MEKTIDVRKPKSASDLPTDLLLDIFGRLIADPFSTEAEICTALRVSCSVCRTWSGIAHALLYRRVFLTSARSTLAFMRTLEASPHGTFVEEIRIWTAIYEYPGTIGSAGPAERRSWLSKHPPSLVRGDRFMDIVVHKCPCLRLFSVENRATNDARSIVLPHPIEFAPDILGGLRCLKLDASHSVKGRGFWLVEAASSGKLAFPFLEDLRLRCRGSEALSAKWAPLPALRRLLVTEISLYDYASVRALLDAASGLEEVILSHLRIEEHVRLTLPSTLTLLSVWDSLFPIPELALFLAPCAASLTDLELLVSYTSTDEQTWPVFGRLRRFKTTWWCVYEWCRSLIASVLPTLRTLEIVGDANVGDPAVLADASAAVLDLLSDTPHRNVESMLLIGNSCIDVPWLVSVLNSMERLRHFGIGTDVEWLPALASQLPESVQWLDLHLLGEEDEIREFLLETFPSAVLPSTIDLLSVCIIQSSRNCFTESRRRTMSRFRRSIRGLNSPRIMFEIDIRHDIYPDVRYRPPPVEETLEPSFWPALRKMSCLARQ